jgi:hypothetical protein
MAADLSAATRVGTSSTGIPLRRESAAERAFIFLSGIIVGMPVALFFESVSHLHFTALGVATIVALLVEEFAKADPLFFRYERSGKSLMRFGLLSGFGFGIAEFFVCISGGGAIHNKTSCDSLSCSWDFYCGWRRFEAQDAWVLPSSVLPATSRRVLSQMCSARGS